ncbi:hypothetical protein BV898_08211 [Hypsibius exemplaris]|uniref:Protein kinase domain-containing protein n=1 Tax=Hypsibius exemplaris TaxID=2072580 RepID=A0A1W0WRD5_HYPEX|nr:hypothetical protein BV898_08211 [Hypsibius exemplaris]
MVTMHGVRKIYPELGMGSKKEIDIEIEALFGNGFLKVQEALERRIDEGFKQNRKDLNHVMYTTHLQGKYEHMRDRLTIARRQYQDFLRNPHPDTWSEFHAAERVLNEQMIILYGWITEEVPLCRQKLMQGLAEHCTVEQYKEWQQDICLMFTQAYFLRFAKHYFTVTTGYGGAPGAISGKPSTRPEDGLQQAVSVNEDYSMSVKTLPGHVRDNLCDMKIQAETVYIIMTDTLQSLRMKFLSESCKLQHNQASNECGAAKNGKCFELGSRVFKHLGSTLNDNEKLAQIIAKDVRKEYPHFQWSVVVTNHDQRFIDLQLKHQTEVWFHKFGSKQSITDAQPENFVVSTGAGYGCLLCYRVEKNLLQQKTNRTALIFWGEMDNIKSADAMAGYTAVKAWANSDAQRVLASTAKPAGNGALELHRVATEITSHGIDYVLGVGVNSRKQETAVGLALYEHVYEMPDSAGTERRYFPFCLTTNDAVILILPRSGPVVYDPVAVVEEATLQVLAHEWTVSQQRISVLTGWLSRGSAKTRVVLKEISLPLLPGKERETEQNLAKLTEALADLRTLRHENIASHLDILNYRPPPPTLDLKCRVIMEFCEGGSLTERVAQCVAPAGLTNIREWGLGILRGLHFLHDHSIAHRALYADHIMFHRDPASGTDVVKIISVKRLVDVIPTVQASFNPNVQSKLPPTYQTPGDQMIGRKTDIWHFGCLLIQMATGRAPEREEIVLERGQKRLGKAMIPTNVPERLAAIIQDCVDLSYDNRPTALVLINKWVF